MAMQKTIMMDVTVGQDLWPTKVVNEIQKVMERGLARHPDGGWENVSVQEHLERAHDHLAEARESHDLRIPKSEDHLAHAFCRLMMAVAIDRGYVEKEDVDA